MMLALASCQVTSARTFPLQAAKRINGRLSPSSVRGSVPGQQRAKASPSVSPTVSAALESRRCGQIATAAAIAVLLPEVFGEDQSTAPAPDLGQPSLSLRVPPSNDISLPFLWGGHYRICREVIDN